MFLQGNHGTAPGTGIDRGDGGLDLVSYGGRHMVTDVTARVEHREQPSAPRIGGRRVLQLQQVLQDALDLASYGQQLALAQILDLFGQMLEVERAVPALARQTAQRIRLVAGPLVEVLVVEFGGFRHGCLRHSSERSSSRRTASPMPEVDTLASPGPAMSAVR